MVAGTLRVRCVEGPEIGLGSMEREEAEALEDALAGLENEGGRAREFIAKVVVESGDASPGILDTTAASIQ